MKEANYPGILDRAKAILTDGVVIIVLMCVISYIFTLFETVSDNVRIIAFVFIFLLYDPLFTSIFGGTLGHIIMGLRVKRESNEQQNIHFHLAVIRYIFKASLGLISLLTISGNKKGKAIHDILVGSVVIHVKPK